jgi:hypothetical protein
MPVAMDTSSVPSSDPAEAAELVCPGCGYELRGIASDRCPECGLAIDRATMSVSRLPWAHRKRIGRFRAYWRTNLMAIFRPGKVAEEMNRPVRFQDAQRFRHFTVLLAWVPVAAWGIALLIANPDILGFPLDHPRGLGWWLEAVIVLSAVFSSWLFLLMISGAGSYLFHPRSMPVVRQNRAVALSYYACAPLAWLWLAGALFAVSASLVSGPYRAAPDQVAFGFMLGGLCVTVAVVVLFWFRVIILMRRMTHCGIGRTLALAIYLPVSWLLLYQISAAIPLAVFLVSVIILSFR